MGKLTLVEIRKLLLEPLGKRVDQRVIEKWAATFWDLADGRRTRDDSSKEKSFVMMFPPPNITGNLHLGHALTGAVQDALIRQRRMQGYRCMFIPGFDHAGLATQMVVEKVLWKQQGMTRHQLGRQKFVELANHWKQEKLKEMKSQLGRLGLNLDYDREYFTMDEESSFAVRTAFKRLFDSGIIYRANKPIFWCDSLQSTISDIEVEQVSGRYTYVRTGETVERRSLSQWFINAKSMAERAVEVIEDGSIEMIPGNYKRSWSAWLMGNGVQDWCISRQSWWGHRIPAYKATSAPDVRESWVVADDISEAQTKLGCLDVEQDPDVLDTWFSSSLLPLTVSGWPQSDKFNASGQDERFPLHIMETGFDILTYWVSKMVMISLSLTGQVPFKLVLLHGMICDSEGKKMSKSLGNVIDPLDVIDGASLSDLQARTHDAHSLGILEERQLQSILDKQKKLFPKGIPECGADGLRAYLLSHDVHEEVVRIQILQIEKVRRLANKIWNVFRLLFGLLEKVTLADPKPFLQMDIHRLSNSNLDLNDQQVLSSMSVCVAAAHEAFHDTYQMHRSFNLLEMFINLHLSQSYLQSAKSIFVPGATNEEVRMRKLEVLATCSLTSIKLLHPFMPHLTEFLYQKLVVQCANPESELTNWELKLLTDQPYPKNSDWVEFYGKLPPRPAAMAS